MSFVESIVSQISANADSVLLIIIFAAVFLATLAGAVIWGEKGAVRRRLEPSGEGAQGAKAGKGPPRPSVLKEPEPSVFDRLLKPLQRHVVPTDRSEHSTMQLRLIQAGYFSPSAVNRYYASRVLLGFALPLGIVGISPFISQYLQVESLLMVAAVMGVVGLYLPSVWVSHRIQARQQAAREGFPDALDLLLVCVEAGLGLNAALDRVGKEIGRAYPVLSTAFEFVGMELRAGKSREVALRNMADRLGIDEVKSLVTILIQSEALGTSIAQALRVHAEDMRVRRMLRAEEAAHKLPVKLSFPLVGFILPCLVLVILTPAIIRVARVLLPTLQAPGG